MKKSESDAGNQARIAFFAYCLSFRALQRLTHGIHNAVAAGGRLADRVHVRTLRRNDAAERDQRIRPERLVFGLREHLHRNDPVVLDGHADGDRPLEAHARACVRSVPVDGNRLRFDGGLRFRFRLGNARRFLLLRYGLALRLDRGRLLALRRAFRLRGGAAFPGRRLF